MRRKISAIMLIILAAVVFCCGCTGTEATAVAQDGVQENTVGILLPLSRDFAEASRVALEEAAVDINDYFASIGSDYRIRLVVEDTQTDPAVALEKFQAFDKQGIKVVIGPGSSAELEAIRTYADEHGIIIVSTLSTAPSLAIEGDNAFRFVSPDTFQADAMANYLEEDGMTAVVPVWRGDIWGDELRNLTAAAFGKRSGTFLDGVRYTPNSQDYTNVVAELDRKVGRAIAAQGKERVGVYAVTFSEAAAIMTAAAETKNLTQVRWYGCDSNTLLSSLTMPGDAARFAVQTDFTGPAFCDATFTSSDETTYREMQDRLGRQPDGFCLASYDALWIVALTRTQTDSTDVSELKRALTEMTAKISGPFCSVVDLDAAGDRSTAHYCFWSVKADGDASRWVPVARYDIWSEGIAPILKPIPA
ncbi:ABC transporter substrate-binding protein [Methanogenium sp. MK-MG]|uniref:ABC transporter substrate-binding protein n=1 Tax=Methanogenium sp. MK-MG TaxID=2599926 RepID=UPI0013EAD8D4|nr:ABC transporter substrate-binding protein [Methanogenium sp. MK-MG]KAF1075259.1 hypothetical protein MKMG_01752 [Methanogenium sp. MK-MG]